MNRIVNKIVLGVMLLLSSMICPIYAQDAANPPPFTQAQIEQLVAPIALYPDPLVAQILMATTYPLEIVSAARFAKANPGLKDQALQDALQKETWDPSVKSLVVVPEVLDMLNKNLDMTQRLGDAFLAQPKDVMDSIQRLRTKAEAQGALKSGEQQTVTTVQEAGKTNIIIQPSNPDVVYVPRYNPSVVYGAWPYPEYPPYSYYPTGYVAGGLLSFAAGAVVGSALWGNCNWGYGNVNVNVNRYNQFNRANIANGNWQHNPIHRGAVPYRDAADQRRYGQGQRANAQTRANAQGQVRQGLTGKGAANRPAGAAATRAGQGARQKNVGASGARQPAHKASGGRQGARGQKATGSRGAGGGRASAGSRGHSGGRGAYGGGGRGGHSGGGGRGGRGGGRGR
jgi:hypothetical protein